MQTPFERTPNMTTVQADVSRIRAEATDAWLVAAQMNVYYEAIRRKSKRVVLGPADISRLFTMIAMLLEVNHIENQPVEARPHTPTEDEAESILSPPLAEGRDAEGQTHNPSDVPNALKNIKRRM